MNSSLSISVGARSSNLSRVQVQEVLTELRSHYPCISFKAVWLKTTGDMDLKTSLRELDRTDFFTKEIDELQLQGKVRISIHSAKDLAHPLRKGLKLIALTSGVDPSDSLVLRDQDALTSLPAGAIIATSSIRREEMIKALRVDLAFVDIRGTIEQRLDFLFNHQVDGVVIAEAALIRLGLTHLNRVKLPGPTVPGQGQLAILARDDDHEMDTLFRCMDSRRI